MGSAATSCPLALMLVSCVTADERTRGNYVNEPRSEVRQEWTSRLMVLVLSTVNSLLPAYRFSRELGYVKPNVRDYHLQPTAFNTHIYYNFSPLRYEKK